MIELQLSDDYDGPGYWWSGGSDSGIEGQWYWQHSLLDVGEFVWGSQQPENSTENNYLCFLKDYDYMGAACVTNSDETKPICQKPANDVVHDFE